MEVIIMPQEFQTSDAMMPAHKHVTGSDVAPRPKPGTITIWRTTDEKELTELNVQQPMGSVPQEAHPDMSSTLVRKAMHERKWHE
eukprot:6236557-Amphidinium_carterae.1